MRTPLFLLVGLLGVALLLVPVSRAHAQDEFTGSNPIGEIAGDMGDVVRDLARLKTGPPTQENQTRIVEKLDKLIAELDKECDKCKGARASANPARPAADSIIRSGPGGQGDLHAAKSSGKKWGELPAHQRDRILQAQTEGFPPHYQRILERYYKRLAEGSTAGSDAGAAATDSSASERK